MSTVHLGRPDAIVTTNPPKDDELLTITISKAGAKELITAATDGVSKVASPENIRAFGDVAAKITGVVMDKGPAAAGALLGHVATHAPTLVPVIGDAIKTLTGAASAALADQVKAGVGSASSLVSDAVGKAVTDTKNKAVNVALSPFRLAAGIASFGADLLLGSKKD